MPLHPVRAAGGCLVLAAALDACVLSVQSAPTDLAPPSPNRGLLASAGLEGQPMKAVYFFAGERGKNTRLYTTHPTDERDDHWNSDPSTRPWVMDRMVAAHVNTIVMSDWSNMPQSSPMALDGASLRGVLDAVGDRPLRVLPAIESGSAWQFSSEFPTNAAGEVAPGLVERVGEMVSLFEGRMKLWAQLYDRDGAPRYAVNVIHASSTRMQQRLGIRADDELFAQAFDLVAAEVERRYGIQVGFTLDVTEGMPYSATPAESGWSLERAASVLAIQSFEPEVSSGVVKSAAPCSAPAADCVPYDNNVDNLPPIARWKRANTRAWVATGVPVILAVSNGFDGRFVWARDGAGFWGDNMESTDDRFRNWVSEIKGAGIKGITFDTWNGYTEGYAAVVSSEHGDVVYRWLTDLLRPDPRKCNHTQYAIGLPTYEVYGSICAKWIRLGGDRGFGVPTSPELSSAHGRVSNFADGKSIYWSHATGAHEVHGAIALTYYGAGADSSCLGLPVADEVAAGQVRLSRFEHGLITFAPGDAHGSIHCS